MSNRYHVVIYDSATDRPTHVIQGGPMPLHRAERVERGANINLDHERFHTCIVQHEDLPDLENDP